MPTTKKKSTSKKKPIAQIEHKVFSSDSLPGEHKGLYISRRMTPKEYVDLLSGKYKGVGSYELDYGHLNTQNSPHNTPRNNDIALKRLRDHVVATKGKEDEIGAKNFVGKILKSGKLSPATLKDIFKRPEAYGYADSNGDIDWDDLQRDAEKQDLPRDLLMDLATDDEKSLGSLIKHPNADAAVANALIQHKPDKISAGQLVHMLSTTRHSDPSKRMLDNNKIEQLVLGKHQFPSGSKDYYGRSKYDDMTNELLNGITPEPDESGIPVHNRKDKIVDKLLGIEGGRHDRDLEDVDDPEEFAYENWRDGQHKGNREQVKTLLSSRHLKPHHIEHIKRHGAGEEKYALFKNPHIDHKHAAEMYENWVNDDSGKGYNLEDLKEGIKEDFPYEDMSEDLREEAEEQAREDYSMDDYTEHWDDDDWVNRNDFNERFQSENPDADEEAADKAYADEVRYAKEEQTPDHVYEGYDEALSDDIYRNMQKLYDKKMDDEFMHANQEFLPSHLEGKLPSVDAIREQKRIREEQEAREAAAEQERQDKTYLDRTMPKRDNHHAYGDLQHHVEMAKQHADANGGAIDVGQLHKLHPNLKDKWKSIFGSKGKMSSQELEEKLQSLPKTDYNISYKPWTSKDMQNINGQDQVVVRLDHSPKSLEPLKQDPELYNTFSKIQDVSQRSGHPTNANTIAWARVDTSNPQHWMIDEVQSDFGSAARDYLDDNGKSSEAAHVDNIIKYHKNWREALINKVLGLAKQNGAVKVSTHSPESKAAHTGADKVHSVYKDSYQKVPRSMGFRSSQMSELPLSDKGQRTFQVERSGESVADRIKEHLAGAQYHAQLAQAHDKMSIPGDQGFKIIGEAEEYRPNDAQAAQHWDHNVMHAEKFQAHLKALSNLDPTHWAAKSKSQKGFLNKYHEVLKSWGEPVDEQKFSDTGIMMAKQDVQSKLAGSLTGIPVPTMDSALAQQAPAEPHTGHTYDLNPATVKKALQEIADLMKKEIDGSARTKIAQTLKLIKDNKQIIDQLEQQNPQAHQALQSLVQSMVKIFKEKTGEDAEALVHELEIEEQMQEQEAQMQQQAQQSGQESGQSVQSGGNPAKDQPIHNRKMVYAPGSIRRYTAEDERIKDQDGNWNAFSSGVADPNQGQTDPQ